MGSGPTSDDAVGSAGFAGGSVAAAVGSASAVKASPASDWDPTIEPAIVISSRRASAAAGSSSDRLGPLLPTGDFSSSLDDAKLSPIALETAAASREQLATRSRASGAKNDVTKRMTSFQQTEPVLLSPLTCLNLTKLHRSMDKNEAKCKKVSEKVLNCQKFQWLSLQHSEHLAQPQSLTCYGIGDTTLTPNTS